MTQKGKPTTQKAGSTKKGSRARPKAATRPEVAEAPETPPPWILQEEDFAKHTSAMNTLKQHGIEVAGQDVAAVRSEIKKRIAEKIRELDELQHEEVIAIVNGVPVRRRRRIEG